MALSGNELTCTSITNKVSNDIDFERADSNDLDEQENNEGETSLQSTASVTAEHAYFTQDVHNVVLIGDIRNSNDIQTVVYSTLPHINQHKNVFSSSVNNAATDAQTNMTLHQSSELTTNLVSENQSVLLQSQSITIADNVAVSSTYAQFSEIGNIVLATIESPSTTVPSNVAVNLSYSDNTKVFSTPLQVASVSHSRKYFYLTTFEDVEETIRKHTEETFSHFVVAKKTKAFGCAADVIDVSTKFRIHWQSRDLTSTEECAVQIPFNGIPFIYIGEKAYMCHLGRSKACKNKTIEIQDVNHPKKHRSRLTKKQGCPAKIFIKQIATFPQFKIMNNSEYLRTQMSQRLRKELMSNKGDVHHIVQYIGILPDISEHQNHDIGENTPLREPIDPIIRDKIIELTWESGENALPKDIKKRLDNYVENRLFKDKNPPSKNRRRYYPSEKDISNYIYKCRTISKISINEQDQLHMLTERLQHDHPESKLLFCIENDEHSTISINVNDMENTNPPHVNHTITPEMRFLFIYQTVEQQKLLRRYGKQAILTEISKHTTNLPFPLYGVYVPTNCDFQLVYLFIIQARKIRSLKDALHWLCEWNPSWSPKFLIVDASPDQINAAESLFPGVIVHILDESRDLNWLNWVNNQENNERMVGDKEEIMERLLSIAHSYTEESLNKAAQELENSEIWRMSEGLREWFSKEWLTEAKRWVVGYRHDEFFSTLHFDVTLLDEISFLRDAHYNHLKSKKVSDFIKALVEDLVPSCYQRYLDRNIDDYRKQFAASKNPEEYPSYLQNKPSCMANHILKQRNGAKQSSTCNINQLEPGVFCIKEQEHDKEIMYTILFGDTASLPSCLCIDWLKYRLPCKHMLSVFLNYNQTWNYNMLSVLYTSNPCLNIDFSCFDKNREDIYLSQNDEKKEKRIITVPQLQLLPCKSRNSDVTKLITNTKRTSFDTSVTFITSPLLSSTSTLTNNLTLPPGDGLVISSLTGNVNSNNSESVNHVQTLNNSLIFQSLNDIIVTAINEPITGLPSIVNIENGISNISTATATATATATTTLSSASNTDIQFVNNLATACDSFCQELSNTLHQVDNKQILQKVKLDLQVMLNDVKLEISKVPTTSNKRKELLNNLYDQSNKKSKVTTMDSKRDINESHDNFLALSSDKDDRPVLAIDVIGNSIEWIFDNDLNIRLNKIDQEKILNGHYLEVHIIQTVQIILRHQFEDVIGFLDPTAIKSMGNTLCTNVNEGKKCLQIHQGSDYHWSISAKINDNIFFFCCTLTSKADIIQQLLQLAPTSSMNDNILFVERMETNEKIPNCGLFAIAYAVAFAFDIEPRTLVFDENGMRSHLAECLEDMCFSMFPLKSV